MGLARARRRIFARHCHPVSAWSRFLTTPLLLVPFWTRSPAIGAGVAVWFVVNPVMTPEPAHQRAFATRAMLGEELWSADPGRDRPLIALNLVGAVALGATLLASWRRRPGVVASGTAVTMAMTMLSWGRYAAVFDESALSATPETGPALR